MMSKQKNKKNNKAKNKKGQTTKNTKKVTTTPKEEIVEKITLPKLKEEPVLETKKEFIKDNYLLNIIFVTIITFSVELIFKKINHFAIVDYSTLRILTSTILLAMIITIISNLLPKKWLRNILNILYILAYSFYAWLQLGFMNFLGVYISFNTSSQAGAVKDYIEDFIASFHPSYYLIYIPFLLSIVFYIIIRKKEYHKLSFNFKKLVFIPVLLIISYIYYLTLTISSFQNNLQVQDNLSLFLNPNVPTIAINQFGTSVFSITDLRSYLYPSNKEDIFELSYEKEEIDTNREVSSLLDELAIKETNKKYANLNKYFASQKVTDYNDYTGLYEGKNVIFILIESGSYGLINEKYYPNFYKLYSEGWYFENYYSPRNSCATGNNEFSALTGLYSIYNTCTTNTYKNNTYFESIFNLFNDAKYSTTSMHNFTEWYYSRKTSHANMGSTYYGADALKIKTGKYGEWPSDVELMEKAFNIILNDNQKEPWMTWITTVSSHQPYSSSSTLGDLHYKYFKSEGYSPSVSRYMSKLKTFDDALGYMLDTLKEANVLDDTLIVMMPDHYPYGLKEKELLEMYETTYEDYEKEKVPFVIYNTDMEPQRFTTYTSYVDIIPTIANLVNIEYDPRLYMGTDLFSDSHESLVIFADGSWKNEYAYYNASTSKITYYVPNHYTSEEIREITSKAALKTSISTLAIKNNYFAYLKEKMDEQEKILIVEDNSNQKTNTNNK